MSNHIRADRLHDYVEDLLCREERAELEQHLFRCGECARRLIAMRERRRESRAPSGGRPDGRNRRMTGTK